MKLAVIHFMPLEYYPPITNFLNFIGEKATITTRVWSCANIKDREKFLNKKIHIARTSFPDIKEPTGIRLMKYWMFNLNTLIELISYRPHRVLYYETFSVWPVYIYLKYFNRSAKLYIHFHEYSSPEWYEQGMRFVKWYHHLEKKYLFHRASWISQTNSKRRELFLKDQTKIDANKIFVLPNYPPSKWANIATKIYRRPKEILKLVYIGSLSLKDTYIQEVCNWVIRKNGKIELDIYSYNLHEDTKIFLLSLKQVFIKFHDQGIEYDEIPNILQKYDVGLILYKAVSVNYVFNETNKLFEYLVCGLDVWFPHVMIGSLEYIGETTSPKVLTLDFNKLDQYQVEDLIGNGVLPQRSINYSFEREYEKLFIALVNET